MATNSVDYDQAKVVRLGAKAKITTQKYAVRPGNPPAKLKPHQVGVSRHNRRGAPAKYEHLLLRAGTIVSEKSV